MTSTVILDNNSAWTPKQWVLETIFTHIRGESLDANENALADKLDYIIEARIGDFRDLSPRDFRKFVSITRNSFDSFRLLSKDTLKWVDTEDELFGVVFAFLQFYILLRLDSRTLDKDQNGLILVDRLHGWKNKDWICDGIILSLKAYSKKIDWTDTLSTTMKGKLTIYDLSKIPTKQHFLLIKGAEQVMSYFDSKQYVTYAKEIVEILPAAYKAFYEFLKNL